MMPDGLLVCLTPECGKIAQARGICYRCYTRLQRDIKQGKTTMAEAERIGRVLASRQSNRWGLGAKVMRVPQAGLRYSEGDR